MKSLSKVFPIFALTGLLMLAGCASDELPSNGSGPGTTVPPIGTTTESGTVKFTNNTAMTIGSSQETAMTRADEHDASVLTQNQACSLNIEDEEEAPSETTPIDYSMSLDVRHIKSGPFSIGDNGVLTLTNNNTDSLTQTIHVYSGGTLNVPYNCDGSTTGAIIIHQGGIVNFTDGIIPSRLIVRNYGGSVNSGSEINPKKDLTINNLAVLKTKGNLTFNDLTVYGDLYVDGNLTCYEQLTIRNGATIHVLDNLSYSSDLTITDHEVDICVEGKMSVKNMTVNCGANIHASCYLEVSETLTLTNSATLSATHIKATTTDLTNDSYNGTNIWLTSGGVAEFGDLILGNNVLFSKGYGDTKALIDCNKLTLPSDDISGIIGNSFYLTYEELTGSYTTESDITFADNSLINVAAVNENSTDDCNPGYTRTDIIIPLPDDIVSGFGSYILDADDFSIRINGDYIEDITVEGNTASLGGIVVTDNNTLNITLSGIKDENIEEGKDYTYEVYIWIRNVNPTPEAGTGAYLPLFGTKDYMRWIGMTDEEIAKAELPLSPDVNTGVDVTNEDIQASNLKVQSPAGYFVRYNIHRGLQGKIDSTTGLGDTPYIKVSIHIQKDPTMPANSAILIYSSDKKE